MKAINFLYQRNYGLLVLAGLSMILLTTGKDLFHAYFKGYHFYLSESMLFGTYWWLFIPGLIVYKRLIKKSNSVGHLLLSIGVSILHIILFGILVHLISWFVFEHTFGFIRVFTESFVDNGIACFLVYGGATLYYTKFAKRDNEKLIEKKDEIRVKHKGRVVLLSRQDILYVTTDRPYLALFTEKKKYLYFSSLKSFTQRYLDEDFIQIHKSTIVNTNFIKSFESRKNGDYNVLLNDGTKLKASRTYNSYFRD
ncbi:MAG: LytTR family transcriptional regulator [Crocinitomicaceae bacterium]|nr:LytTR family transcriptional regulator [Crocinitomicaceae bacterium]